MLLSFHLRSLSIPHLLLRALTYRGGLRCAFDYLGRVGLLHPQLDQILELSLLDHLWGVIPSLSHNHPLSAALSPGYFWTSLSVAAYSEAMGEFPSHEVSIRSSPVCAEVKAQ